MTTRFGGRSAGELTPPCIHTRTTLQSSSFSLFYLDAFPPKVKSLYTSLSLSANHCPNACTDAVLFSWYDGAAAPVVFILKYVGDCATHRPVGSTIYPGMMVYVVILCISCRSAFVIHYPLALSLSLSFDLPL